MNKTVTRSESKEIDTALRDQMIFEKMQNIIESDLFRGGLIVLMILLGLGIYLMNHMIVVRIQYDINGTVIDHRAGEIPGIELGDEGSTCFGFGRCTETEKIFVGFDPEGVRSFRLTDSCYVDEIPRECSFNFTYTNKRLHFRDEALYIHFVSNDDGNYICSADCGNAKTSIETFIDPVVEEKSIVSDGNN
ncbi:MAG: hypothetical protein IKQ27_12610 [Lachnospiraceae bacterium]|nr:hypothetical protein [Lachnospiraceae bacterium]